MNRSSSGASHLVYVVRRDPSGRLILARVRPAPEPRRHARNESRAFHFWRKQFGDGVDARQDFCN